MIKTKNKNIQFKQISLKIEEIIGKMNNTNKLEKILKLTTTANSIKEFKQSYAKIQ